MSFLDSLYRFLEDTSVTGSPECDLVVGTVLGIITCFTILEYRGGRVF